MSKATIGGEAIRQVAAGFQSRLFQAVVCAAIVMCATSAQAAPSSASGPQVTRSQDNQQDFPFGDNDPCIGGVVSGLGHFHSQFIDRSTPLSTPPIYDTEFILHQNGQGTNSTVPPPVPPDTAQYQFQSFSDFRFQSSANFWFTQQIRKHIIRQGPLPPGIKDNYFDLESVTFSSTSPIPVINSFKSESTCK